jgi:hypothetical protein
MKQDLLEAIEKADFEVRQSLGQLTPEELLKMQQEEEMRCLGNALYLLFRFSTLAVLNYPSVIWLDTKPAIEIRVEDHVFHLIPIEEYYVRRNVEGNTLLTIGKSSNNIGNHVLVALGKALRV